jgi:hypothetical protein
VWPGVGEMCDSSSALAFGQSSAHAGPAALPVECALAEPGVISVAQSDCMFPEWFGPGSTFATDARTVDRCSFRAVSSLRACRDVEKARLERAFSLRLGRRANGQLPTGWK